MGDRRLTREQVDAFVGVGFAEDVCLDWLDLYRENAELRTEIALLRVGDALGEALADLRTKPVKTYLEVPTGPDEG